LAEIENRKGSTPYERIKALQQAVKLQKGRKPPVKELLVLSQNKDPFYSGSAGDIAKAKWFAHWFGETSGQHLRRVHYRIVSKANVIRPDGKLYENDGANWDYLNTAARHARYLGYVDPEDVVDRRNPPGMVNMLPAVQDDPSFTYSTEMNSLDRIHTTLSLDRYFSPLIDVDTEVSGYVYEQAMQPYHLEVWAEKTTANDILIPLCEEFGANYISGAGYMSITAVVQLLRDRVEKLKKPVRIFYISDYDKSGENMPRQMSRQTQFWTDVYAADHDIKVEPIVLTAQQARRYPPAPDSNKVELDAMLELDPDRFYTIVREHLSEYRDFDLQGEVAEAEREAEEEVDAAIETALEDELEELEEIKRDVEKIYKAYRGPLKRLALELNRELRPYDKRLETLQLAVEEKLGEIHLHLPELPEGEIGSEADEERQWLYSSYRDYLDQLEVYKERKGKAE
jgi:hypothetical protein